MAERVIAQRILTGDIIDWDVPLALQGGARRDLSGPGSLIGTLEPEYARLDGKDGFGVLEPWRTALYYEVNGSIRWGGIVTGHGAEGQRALIEAAGFTCYPRGIPFLGKIRAGVKSTVPSPYAGKDKNHDGYVDGTTPPRSVKVPKPKTVVSASIDALDVVRTLWNHVQAQPDGDLGLILGSTDSGYMLGARSGDDPYELMPWDVRDCGEEIDSLAQEARFEYVETHGWANKSNSPVSIDAAGRPSGHPDFGQPAGKDRFGHSYSARGYLDAARRPKGDPAFGKPAFFDADGQRYPSGTSNGQPADEQIRHVLSFGHPRLGRRRTDLRFVQDENIQALANAEQFAEFTNEVVVLGRGEGAKGLHGIYPRRDGRLRRVKVLTDKSVTNVSRMERLAKNELARRTAGMTVPLLHVRDHPNARIGSWQLGDDILVQVTLPWVGDLSVWHRIVGDELLPNGGGALLTLIRSDVFA